MLMPLTDIQQRVFNELAHYYSENKYPPTARELAAACGKTTVSNEVIALRKKGWAVKLENQHSRSTCPTDEALERVSENS